VPNIQSAKKKLKQDKIKTKRNLKYKHLIDRAIKSVKKEKDQQSIKKAYSIIDKAAKKRVIHKNKAARLKSRIGKLMKKNEKKN
jgi:small subunit ribosomal protein S20